ncbi:hypothetical protein [Peribacillus loiseleuriae]|uniref:hypothetical protein n=1 Tax=Peribacillus loiseleuriae TaxID=1679170 RepID=UPI003D04D7AE
MTWIKVFGLLSAICSLAALVQILRFRRELKKMDKDQESTDELAKKWNKRLYSVIFWGVSGMIFSVITYIFRFLYAD